MLQFILSLLIQSNAYSQSTAVPFFLYAPKGEELEVRFEAQYLTSFQSFEEIQALRSEDRTYFVSSRVEPTLKYLFGPLTERGWAGVKKTLNIDLHWDQAVQTQRGITIPYTYKGLWLVSTELLDRAPNASVPVPYNSLIVFTENWQRCGAPHHPEEGSLWYYWDPDRPLCNHKKGREYQLAPLEFLHATEETLRSYPEYARMIRMIQGRPVVTLTFAFGYNEEPENPEIETDRDVGAQEYRTFVTEVEQQIPSDAIIQPILRSEYPHPLEQDLIIGKYFQFNQGGVDFRVKVLMNAKVDQIVLFAQSFAKDYDSYFAWLGHSRVGSGFDAHRFQFMLRNEPQRYSIARDYQILFWGGCNSYSYYTEPFFRMKAATTNTLGHDPNGTRELDIVANGLPSFFGLNAASALLHFKAFTHPEQKTSYQQLLQQTERLAAAYNSKVLAVVLGDEDNDRLLSF